MPVHMEKEDLRSRKTEKALNIAMFSLLENRKFGKITVRDICEEALISRATFYAHFTDKFDLLKDWLVYLKPENIRKDDPFEQIEKTVNHFIYKNTSVIKNLVCDADDKTLEILFDSFLSGTNFSVKNDNEKRNTKYVVLSNFYAGGMMYYLSWHVKNRFPEDVPPMNIYLYEIIQALECQ